MRYLIASMFIVAAVIHLVPLSGVAGGDRLAILYGLPMDEPNLSILMRHRAVLFGIVGGLLLAAAFFPSLQVAALIVGFVSVVSFLWLVQTTAGYNSQLLRVFKADIVALAALLIAAVAYFFTQLQRT